MTTPRTEAIDALTALTIGRAGRLLIEEVCSCGGQESRRVWRRPGDLRNKHRDSCLAVGALSRLAAVVAEARVAALLAVEGVVGRLPLYDEADRIVTIGGDTREPRTMADAADAFRTRVLAAIATLRHSEDGE